MLARKNLRYDAPESVISCRPLSIIPPLFSAVGERFLCRAVMIPADEIHSFFQPETLCLFSVNLMEASLRR